MYKKLILRLIENATDEQLLQIYFFIRSFLKKKDGV
jgi:hypothetical protein